MASAKEIVAGVRDLLTLPEIYLKLQDVLRNPGAGMSDVVQIVQTDPALTARVLRVANSAMFNLSRKVETLSLAVTLMGTSRLHDIVLSTSVISSFSRLTLPLERMQAFWQRSVHTAILARLLATHCHMFLSERLFIAGLLHDVGHLILDMQATPELHADMAAAIAAGESDWQAEERLAGAHYGQVGAALMRLWDFPESLAQICEFHMQPQAAADCMLECNLIHVARHVVQATGDAGLRGIDVLAGLDAAVLADTGLDPATILRTLDESTRQLAEVVELLVQRRSA